MSASASTCCASRHEPGGGFAALLEGAVGLGDKPAVAGPLDATTLFLAIQAAVPVEEKAVAQATPAIAAAVARTDSLPVALRLAAAERAAGAGLIEGALLGRLYAEFPLPPERLAEPLAEAEKHPGAEGRAVLYQAARLEVVPARRLERLAAGWRHARDGDAGLAFGLAAAPLVREVSPRSTWHPSPGRPFASCWRAAKARLRCAGWT